MCPRAPARWTGRTAAVGMGGESAWRWALGAWYFSQKDKTLRTCDGSSLGRKLCVEALTLRNSLGGIVVVGACCPPRRAQPTQPDGGAALVLFIFFPQLGATLCRLPTMKACCRRCGRVAEPATPGSTDTPQETNDLMDLLPGRAFRPSLSRLGAQTLRRPCDSWQEFVKCERRERERGESVVWHMCLL